jgi:peptidoglycan hydrolase-like protein with peptidoglycan-binding domain
MPVFALQAAQENAEANLAREEALRACLAKGPVEGPALARRMLAPKEKKPESPLEPGPEPSSPAEADLIRSTQEGLRLLDYSWVPVDGRLGSCTRAAIRLFQNSSEYTGSFVDEMPSQQLLNDIKRSIQKGALANQPVLKPNNCPPLTSGEK